MSEDAKASYAFDVDRGEEERRLIVQSQLLEEPSERWLRAAGLAPGMRSSIWAPGPGTPQCWWPAWSGRPDP